MAPAHIAQALPLLSALVFLPALGAPLVMVTARSKSTLASWLAAVFAGITLAVAVVVLFGGVRELHPWIPSLGVTFILESDGLAAVVVAWMAFGTALALGITRPGARTSALALCLQAAANGLVLSGDVFLALACLGAGAVVTALLTTVPRNVLVFAITGLTVLFGWFVRFYQLAYSQTGFVSTELARWRSLVLYPREEQALFLWGGLGVLLLLPAFAIALENVTPNRAQRLVLFATAGTMGSVFVARVLVPLCPSGAQASSASVLALSVLLMAWAGLARGWTLLAVGYQGLIVFGLFSFPDEGAEPIIVAASVGFFALVLASSHRLVWGVALLLVALPGWFILVPAWDARPLWATLATGALALMAFGLVRVAKRARA